MNNLCRLLQMAVLAAAVAAPALGQESVEGRILEILRAKGIIDDAEHAELRELEARLREESDLEGRLERQVSEMVARLDRVQPETGYRAGRGFSWETADKRFLLNVGGRIQVRFTHGFVEGEDNEPDFDVPRARIWLQGHAFEPWWKYKLQLEVAGDEADTVVAGSVLSSRNRLTELKDAHIDFARWKAFNVRAGQFKAPYSRHHLTSSARLQFVDRAPTNGVFAPQRQVGVMAHGSLGGEKEDFFEYYAGMFDGEGENRTNNDKGLMWVGRVAVNPLGGVPYTESDLKRSEEFLLAVAVNAWLHQDDNMMSEGDDWGVGADVAAFWSGFSGLVEIHYRENDVSGGPDVEILGWLAQLGYMLIPETLEVALRASETDWDNSSGDRARREYLGVLGWFLEQHNLKIQTDFGRVERHRADPDTNRDEWRWRVQLQIIF